MTRFSTPAEREYAVGLHLEGTAQTFMFDEYRSDGRLMPFIAIGRTASFRPHMIIIDNDDHGISEVHAVLERQHGPELTIKDSGSTNGILINGRLLDKPVALTVGMKIELTNRTRLWGVNTDRLVPFPFTRSMDELCFRARLMYGSYREAERRYLEDPATKNIGREQIQTHAQAWLNKITPRD